MIKQFKIDLLVFVKTQYEKGPNKRKEISKCLEVGVSYLNGEVQKSDYNNVDSLANSADGYNSLSINVYWACINLVYNWSDCLTLATNKVAVLWGNSLDTFLLTYNQKEGLTDDEKYAYYEQEAQEHHSHYYNNI